MTDPQLEDPELLERLAEGDRDALAALFDQHRDRLRRMVRARLHPRLQRRIDAEDILQEAWLDALQRIDSFEATPGSSAFVWLRLVLGQTLVDLHRRHLGAQKRDAMQEVPMRLGAPAAHSQTVSMQLTGGLTSPSAAAVRAESRRILEDVLDRMDPMDREVLVLRHLEELTNAEVAAALDIQPSAASNRYIRALNRLRGLASGIDGFGADDDRREKPE